MAALTKSDGASAAWNELATYKEARAGLGRRLIVLGAAFLLVVALVMMEKDEPLGIFYGRCIDLEIARCETADGIYSVGAAFTALNKQAARKARFYKENRDRLIASMEEQGLGKDPQRTEYFLHQAARNGFRVAGTGSVPEEPKGGMSPK